MGKGGIARKVKLAFAGLGIGLALTPAMVAAARHYNTVEAVPLENPAPAQEQTDYGTEFLKININNPYVLKAALDASIAHVKEQLAQKGINPDQLATKEDLEQIVEDALPHIARELNLQRINKPKIVYGERAIFNLGVVGIFSGRQGFYNMAANEISLRRMPIEFAKLAVVHESVHAQHYAVELRTSIPDTYRKLMPLYSFKSGLHSEKEVELATFEILASQALNGDLLARFAVYNRLREHVWADIRQGKGETLSRDEQLYYAEPYSVLKSAIARETPTHGRIGFNNITALLQEAFLTVQNAN